MYKLLMREKYQDLEIKQFNGKISCISEIYAQNAEFYRR